MSRWPSSSRNTLCLARLWLWYPFHRRQSTLPRFLAARRISLRPLLWRGRSFAVWRSCLAGSELGHSGQQWRRGICACHMGPSRRRTGVTRPTQQSQLELERSRLDYLLRVKQFGRQVDFRRGRIFAYTALQSSCRLFIKDCIF